MGGTAVTPNAPGNPFADDSLTNHPSAQAQPAPGNPFADESLTADATPTGQVTNDVGQPVVTPLPGESFTDTVNRAKALQKGREQAGTQQQALDAETATIPKKAAQTLGTAAALGAAVPTAGFVVPELTELAVKHLAGNVLPGMEEAAARAKLAEIAPKALQIVKDWALPASAVGGLLKLLSMGKGKE